MEMEKTGKDHGLTLKGRKECHITGVKDVISFDVNAALLETEMGMLDIKGSDLHMNRLELTDGEIEIDGKFDAFTYSAAENYRKPGDSFFKRVFR